MRSFQIVFMVTTALTLLPKANADLMINFTGSTGNAQADAGFQLAADFIRANFNDNATITLNRGFAALGSGILGQAGFSLVNIPYSSWRTAITNDATTANDNTFASSLPTGTGFSVYTNRTANNGNSATPYVDNTGNNTTQVQITTANARALGFSLAPGADGTITFSSSFNWDFDNRDGIDAGKQDFVGVAIHEIMHAMGFVSNVDVLDQSPNLNDDAYRVTGLDFARHSADSLAAGANIDFTADTRAKFFSINGGSTNLTPGALGGWATGVAFGDGWQASHWKDNLGLGIMDPTAQPSGTLNVVTNLDLMALDIIGWNRISPVPEPSTAMLLAIALAGLSRLRRKEHTC